MHGGAWNTPSVTYGPDRPFPIEIKKCAQTCCSTCLTPFALDGRALQLVGGGSIHVVIRLRSIRRVW